MKKAFLKNFAIFTGKHLCWSYFLIKLRVWKTGILLKRDSNAGVFLWILRNFSEHLLWRTFANGCFWKGGTDFLLMRFWSFTIEIWWEFLHFLSVDFFIRVLLLLKSIMGIKFRRSHVCLHSQTGIRLWQLMTLLFFVMLWSFLYKNSQVIKSNTTDFLRIQRHNRKVLKRMLKRQLK